MTDKHTILDDEELKRIEEQYDPEGTVDIEALMNEVQPKRWHHEWAWSQGKTEAVGMAQMLLMMGFILYLVIPFPKPVWALPVGVALLILILGLWRFGMKYQSAMDARFPFLGATFYMGGKPDCGMQQLRVWFPVVRSETSPDVQPVNIHLLRMYLRDLAVELAQKVAEQRQTLSSLGVEVPKPLPDALVRQSVHPLGYLLSHPKPAPSILEQLFGWVANWWPLVMLVGILGVIWSGISMGMFFLVNVLLVGIAIPPLLGSVGVIIFAILLRRWKHDIQQRGQPTPPSVSQLPKKDGENHAK